MNAMATEEDFVEVRNLAASRGLLIEGGDILYSEVQAGTYDESLICVDRWLAWRDGGIRMQVRVLAREKAERQVDWDFISEGGFSDPLSKEQALQLVSHWVDLQREALARHIRRCNEAAERVEAFGPGAEPPRPQD